MSEMMSAKWRAECVMSLAQDPERDRAMRTERGLCSSETYRQRFAAEMDEHAAEAVRAALAASSERERALREERDSLGTLAATTEKRLANCTSQLAAARAEARGERMLRDSVMSDSVRQLAAKDAEIARLTKERDEWKHEAEVTARALNRACSSPRASERGPEWIAAAEACIEWVRLRFRDTIRDGAVNYTHPTACRAIDALRALDAQTARPGQDEDRAVEALKRVADDARDLIYGLDRGYFKIDVPRTAFVDALRASLSAAGMLREGAGK